MYVNETDFKKNKIQRIKSELLNKEKEISSLPSDTIKNLLDYLDWSIENEKRIIINLCREMTKRGDLNIITGENSLD